MKKDKPEEDQTRSPSPSACSTASSGSPLVRDVGLRSSVKSVAFSISSESDTQSTSSRSVRRPAATSIAAAQLNQLEKQQQQNLGAKLKRHSNGNKLAHIMSASKQQQYDQNCRQQQPAIGESHKEINHSDNGKSLGYNIGKLMAYRANR